MNFGSRSVSGLETSSDDRVDAKNPGARNWVEFETLSDPDRDVKCALAWGSVEFERSISAGTRNDHDHDDEMIDDVAEDLRQSVTGLVCEGVTLNVDLAWAVIFVSMG